MKRYRYDPNLQPYKIGSTNLTSGLGAVSLSTTSGGISSATSAKTTTTSSSSTPWYSASNIKNVTDVLGSLSSTALSVWGGIENINLQKKVANAQIKNGQTATPISSQNNVISTQTGAGQTAEAALYYQQEAEASKKSTQTYVLIGVGVLLVAGIAVIALTRKGTSPVQTPIATPPIA